MHLTLLIKLLVLHRTVQMGATFKALNLQFRLLLFHKRSHISASCYSFASSSFTLSSHPAYPRFCFSQFRLYSSSPSAFMEMVTAVDRHGLEAHDSVAIRTDQKSYSYKQLISSAQEISNLLCGNDMKSGNLGGARIGIVAKPSAEFVAAMLGTWLSGGVAVPLALSYPEAELLYVMNNADVSAILSTEDHSQTMQNVANKSSSQFFLIPPVLNKSLEKSRDEDSQNREMQEERIHQGNIKRTSEDPALILYTSGTTGKPKGVVHTHRSISAQVQTLSKAWEYTSADKFLHCLPLHHVHGLFNALLAPLYAGSTVILLQNAIFNAASQAKANLEKQLLFNVQLASKLPENLMSFLKVDFMPKFSVSGVWQRWRESYPEGTKAEHAITVFTGVPTIYTRLIQGYQAMDPQLQAASASAARNLRLMMCGSSALPQPVMQEWEAITGHRLLERYGMTEFVMAISNPLKGERKAGTVGKPFPGVQVKILADEESGSNVNKVGELCVKSPSLFKEYWKLPEVTKDSFIDDGFFKTGDAVTMDEDGYYIILGRTNADIMKVGGYKLSALEIESVILENLAVSECCVLGLPDKTYGEVVCAIIVAEAGTKKKREQESKPAITLEELSSWAKDRLAPYKIPTRLFLWDSLPRNAMGKVNKKELKQLLAPDQ